MRIGLPSKTEAQSDLEQQLIPEAFRQREFSSTSGLCRLRRFDGFDECERLVPLIDIENSVADVRQQGAFDARCKSHPGLVCDDGYSAKAMKVTEHRQ